MSRFFIKNRKTEPHWKKHLPVHLTGLTVCATVLVITTIEKFPVGGWLTLFITSIVIGLCFLTKAHYNKVRGGVRELDDLLTTIPTKGPVNTLTADPKSTTAIQLVNGFNGFGVHTFLTIIRSFKNLYKNFIFVSVAKWMSRPSRARTPWPAWRAELRRPCANTSIWPAAWASPRISATSSDGHRPDRLVHHRAGQQGIPDSIVFAGQAVFRQPSLIHRLMHNETAFAIQQQLRWKGITAVILPIRINI